MDGEGEFLPTLVAAKMLGMSDAALRRRIRRGLLPVYQDRADHRFRLLRVSDLERLVSARWVNPVPDQEDS